MAITNLAKELVCMCIKSFGSTMKSPTVFHWLLFFCMLEDVGWEITSWQLQTPTDSLTWHITTAKKKTPISCSWAQKANIIRCDCWSHANQVKVIHVEGLMLWKKLPEMFLWFDKSWYQPLLKVFSSANLALSWKINITIGVWWETAAKMCVVLPGLTPLIQVRQQPLQHRDGAVWWHRIPLYWWC